MHPSKHAVCLALFLILLFPLSACARPVDTGAGTQQLAGRLLYQILHTRETRKLEPAHQRKIILLHFPWSSQPV